MKIIKENGNVHLEVQNKTEVTKFSLFNNKGTYELLARRSSHSIYNFVRFETSDVKEIEVLKEFFTSLSECLNTDKVDYIPILKDNTIITL